MHCIMGIKNNHKQGSHPYGIQREFRYSKGMGWYSKGMKMSEKRTANVKCEENERHVQDCTIKR